MGTKVLTARAKKKQIGGFSVKIRPDLAQTIRELAVQRQVEATALVNDILEEHLTTQSVSDTEYLFSMGGMFRSEPSDTSEHVSEIVADYLVKKYEQAEV